MLLDDVVQVDENGEPSMTAFNMLDQSEIENMTVLKDASAAVYGSRSFGRCYLGEDKAGKSGCS
ncbi:MAG: TonB-dependent receptor plug domain-containing protein [Phocaeicola vulgatus]